MTSFETYPQTPPRGNRIPWLRDQVYNEAGTRYEGDGKSARSASNCNSHLTIPVTLPLNEMSLSEKLQFMEALWDDLSCNADTLESPEWHGEVLEEREQRIASGEARFTDWEQAKADIRKRTS